MKKQEVINALVASAKLDIINFIDACKAKGEEIQINGFSDLHDYYDANEYVFDLSDDFESANKVIEELHNWIKESIAKQDSQIENSINLNECVAILNQVQEMTCHTSIVKHYDNRAIGDNLALTINNNTIVLYLPNSAYDTFFLDFSKLYGGTYEEFNTLTEAVDYLIEQVENECI